MNNSFDAAVNRVTAALDAVMKLETALADLPLDLASDLTHPQRAARLKSLDAIDTRLAVDDALPRPLKVAAESFPARFLGTSSRHSWQERLHSLLISVEQQRDGLLRVMSAEETVAAGFIRSGDFGPDGLLDLDMTFAGGQGVMVVGRYQALPDGHPLKRMIDEIDCYKLSNQRLGDPKVIFLGQPLPVVVGKAPARFAYKVSSALALTKHHRAIQVRQQEERAEQLRREQRQQDNDFWQSPAGQTWLQQEMLKKMQELGKIPEYRPAPPAVRH